MKKYFLHNGNEQTGPFDMNELETQKITSETMVWFQGASSWSKAGEIEELKNILTVEPPAFDSNTPPPLTANTIVSKQEVDVIG
jgi:hypothetical protein